MRIYIRILLVTGLVVIAYLLIAPLFTVSRVQENDKEIANAEIIAQGNFVGLTGHRAQGSVQLLKVGEKRYVRFENNFSVTNGPDLNVYLAQDARYNSLVRLGPLQGTVGGQHYEIPAYIDLDQYNEVVVRCRLFFVNFGKAVFNDGI